MKSSTKNKVKTGLWFVSTFACRSVGFLLESIGCTGADLAGQISSGISLACSIDNGVKTGKYIEIERNTEDRIIESDFYNKVCSFLERKTGKRINEYNLNEVRSTLNKEYGLKPKLVKGDTLKINKNYYSTRDVRDRKELELLFEENIPGFKEYSIPEPKSLETVKSNA